MSPAGYAAAVLADSPAGYWRLGETAGTRATDGAGTAHGTYLGGPSRGTATLVKGGDPSVTLDGADDQVSVPSTGALSPSSALTVEVWVRPRTLPAAGGFASVVSKKESYTLQFNGPRLEFTTIQNGTRRRVQAAAGAVPAGSLAHVVGVYDGATQRLYVNGALVASGSFSGALTVNANPLLVGSWDGRSEMLAGTVDDVAVYPRALAAAAVGRHWTAGRPA